MWFNSWAKDFLAAVHFGLRHFGQRHFGWRHFGRSDISAKVTFWPKTIWPNLLKKVTFWPKTFQPNFFSNFFDCLLLPKCLWPNCLCPKCLWPKNIVAKTSLAQMWNSWKNDQIISISLGMEIAVEVGKKVVMLDLLMVIMQKHDLPRVYN